MIVFKKYFLLLGLVVVAGCQHPKATKPSLKGDVPVKVGDFIGFFQPLKLPYQCTDSIFQADDEDSLLIPYKVFTQFIPDSVLAKVFGKTAKPDIYPLGKVEVPHAQTFLFVKTLSGNKRCIFILSFDKKRQFTNALVTSRTNGNSATQQSVTMDRKYTITRTVLRKNADGTMSEGKDVYTQDKDGKDFVLIMTDALDEKVTELINPIDTLPRKYKYSGDYGSGKFNLVSIRDGRKNDRIRFFVHFEKNNGGCTGELKGEAMLRSATMAEYHVAGDPCSLQFNFSGSAVTLKEDGCGSRRGLGCLFDGSFTKKKQIKKKIAKR